MSKANYKKALYHVQKAMKPLEEMDLAILTAKTALPKTDTESREDVTNVIYYLSEFKRVAEDFELQLKSRLEEDPSEA